ncbi:hypothetical protein PP753_gp50 [Dinoroseobacter phage vB_DshP-R7L]|uniref:N4 gp53-like protein n=1 Tax=Dinoroseobacter phage vB_DshP-R7L TaxID=2873349 RepID=A0AAE8XFS7_9CAUD|nr:hypothetical protein PP753_gp50 [Dinoroseobacter phage vB_DshP-R7L]UAT28908.1 hypothetical protein R7L_gp69 [Dinoroseobacter phage vB_DshP-R7L]
MGIFSSKKIINVSSTLYNMAGDENDRPDFLKGTVFGSVMSGSPSIADDITTGYFNGPGLQQRQFFKYCDREDISGLPTATVVNSNPLDTSVVQGEIPPSAVPPAPAGLTLNCYAAEVTDGDFEPWLERWILDNHPERVGEDWLGEYEPTTNTFSVEFPNNDFFSWTNNIAPVYSPSKRYVAAKYIESRAASEDPLVSGTSLTNQPSPPDVTGWDEISASDTFTPVTLQRVRNTILSYNNGDPDNQIETDVDADVPGEVPDGSFHYRREIIVDVNGLMTIGERQDQHWDETHIVTNDYVDVVVTNTDLGGGVIETRTETTTGEQITEQYTTRLDTTAIYSGEQYGPEQIFIYEIGTGNATLDGLVTDVDATGFQEFFPFMPIRIDNVSVAEPQYADLFDEMSKAYKRGYGFDKSFSSLIDKVEDNPSIGDIDYAYLCFGASLNVKEHACRRYIFNFFEKMIPFQQGGSGNAMSNLSAQVTSYNQAITDLAQWEVDVNAATSGEIWGTIPPRPTIPSISPPPTNEIILRDGTLGFDLRTVWVHCEIEQFSGNIADAAGVETALGLPPNTDARRDDIVLIDAPAFSWQERQTYNTRDGEEVQFISRSIPSMYIYWQTADNSYRRMQIWGLTSYNYIYGGKAVTISSTEALADNEESGFLVPLHFPTMIEMGIVDYTQMSTANAHILFNSYEVTKQKWYERGIFKILLVIAIIIIAVVVFPGAFAAGSGILGGNLAVGAALGLTGTAALVAGVVANYVASIIIAELLKVVGTALFGEKWGALFAAIAGFALGMAISGTSLFSAEGLLGLGNAISNGYAGWVQGDIAERQEALESDRNAYEQRMDYINDLIADLGGGNGLNFNPIFLTEGSGNGRGGSRGYMPETADEYIRRTTMTGSDIVEITHSMVYDYVDVAKTLPRN